MRIDKDVPDQVWKDIIQAEGTAYTNKPNDRGGPTKFGISQKGNPDLSTEEIKNLTPERARQLYTERYWNRIPEKDRNWKNFRDKVHTGSYGLSEDKLVKKYLGIIKDDPTQREFLNGWMNRAVGEERFGKNKVDLREMDMDKLNTMFKQHEEPEQPREPAGSFNPSDVDFSLMPSDTPKDPKKVSPAEFDLAVEDAGFGDEPVVEEKVEVKEEIPAKEPAKEEIVEEKAEVKIPETFEPRDLASSVNMSKAPTDTTPEFAKKEPIKSEFMPSVEVETRDLPEMDEDPIDDEIKQDMAMEDLKESQARENLDDEQNLKEENLEGDLDKVKAEKIDEVTGGRFEKGQPNLDKIISSQLVPKEVWNNPDNSLDDIAAVMNKNSRERFNQIDAQWRKDRKDSQKDKLLVTILLAAQAFANGMAVQGTGRRAHPVNLGLLKDIEDSLTDTRDYRMKRAKMTLDQAKFRFSSRKDKRDLAIKQGKDLTKTKEKARLEGKRDKEKLDKEFKKDVESSNKQIAKSHEAAIKDVMRANPKKFEEVVKTSLAGNLGMSDEQIEELTQKPNFFSEITGWDLGTTSKEKDELLRDIRSKMESEIEEKPKSNVKASDTRYNPQIHKLVKKADGKVYIYTKDLETEVGAYGKQ